MQTENEVLDISTFRTDDGTVCLDFRTVPNMDKLGYQGYSSIHFQLAPKDAVKLGKLLVKEGRKK